MTRGSRQDSSWWEWLSGTPREAIRVVEVLPPSQRDEGMWVFLTAGFIVVCVIYIVAIERFGGATARQDLERRDALLPFQVLFRDLPSPQQRVFREMQEGALEALSTRAVSGEWPAVDALAARGIPPFASDVLDRSGLRWSLRRDGLLSQYVGIPSAGTGATAFLISILEPDPETGERASPAVVDEEHQLLPDGRLLHVTYWMHPPDLLPAGVIIDPALQGWKQIRVSSLFEEMEKMEKTGAAR